MNDPIRQSLDAGDVGDACSNSGVASFNDGEASMTASLQGAAAATCSREATTTRLAVCSNSNVLRQAATRGSGEATRKMATGRRRYNPFRFGRRLGFEGYGCW
ncbi:hypothetical protein AB3S75_042299 [Citrus x aurantiifolia]